jgi:hypothetical protein
LIEKSRAPSSRTSVKAAGKFRLRGLEIFETPASAPSDIWLLCGIGLIASLCALGAYCGRWGRLGICFDLGSWDDAFLDRQAASREA